MTRVLLADDHPIMLSGIEAVLRGSDYQVVAAAKTGAEALEAAAAARPDVLVLDVRMPERSGIDVLRVLRGRGDTRPVVLLTADLEDGELMEAIQIGVSGILLKEGAPGLLVECLDAVRTGGRYIDKALLQRALDLAVRPADRPEPEAQALTPRERAIVGLVARGLRNREVAEELNLSEGTVKVYLYRIYEKLGVGNRTELAMLARDRSLG